MADANDDDEDNEDDEDDNANESAFIDTVAEILRTLFIASLALDLDGAFGIVDFSPPPPPFPLPLVNFLLLLGSREPTDCQEHSLL